MKVAILKSRLYRGGVYQVLESIIEVLNLYSIIPDIITLKSDIDKENIADLYSDSAKFNIKEILINIKLPYEWHFVYFNLFTNRILKDYDLVIDSNNSAFLQNINKKSIHYIHFPRKFRAISNLRSIHFPEGKKKDFFNIANDAFNLISKLYRFDNSLKNDNWIIANSEFTKNAILKSYPNLQGKDIHIVYPPVNLKSLTNNSKEYNNKIISLGRISPEKRQLEQIRIASYLPEFNLDIVGFAKDIHYLQECRKLIKQLALTNVNIITNASKTHVDHLLSNATYFMHNVRYEPFGITTVQGIAKGLIPIVHDSGGQKEIVQRSELRFSSEENAADIIRKLRKADIDYINMITQDLQSHVKQYSKENFKKKIDQILKEAMNKIIK